MILINLLPHREAARKRQKDQFFTQLALAAMLGGGPGDSTALASAALAVAYSLFLKRDVFG